MIPLKLNLRNFLCYGDATPTLDLEGIHVACLCGNNGHGKSALLDAVTWALWGKARSSSHDELVHYGRDEMMVELEFLAQDARYRVTRRHTSGVARRRGPSDLQLQVRGDEEYYPITGNSIRDTQVKIDQLTGMDYDTFINSAFLLQGRADEFTNKTPGQRKEVLSRILGLGFYDRLQERAKRHADQGKGAADVLESDLGRMRQDLAQIDGYQSELGAVAKQVEELGSQLKASQESLDRVKAQVDDLKRKREEVRETAESISGIEVDVAELRKQVEASRQRVESLQALIADEESIAKGLGAYREARTRYEALSTSREAFETMTSRKSELQRAIDGEAATLREQVSQLRRRVDLELTPVASAAPFISEKLAEAKIHLSELAKEERAISETARALQEVSGRIGQLEVSTEQLKAEGHDLRSKLDLVQGSTEGARCPLCGGQLGADGCERLSKTYAIQIDEKRRLYKDNEVALKETQQEKHVLEGDLPRRETALKQGLRDGQSALAVLERQLEDSAKAAEELERAQRDLAGKEEDLEHGAYAVEERRGREEMETRIVELGYDPTEQDRLYQEMQSLQHFVQRRAQVEDAVLALPREEEALGRSRDMCARREDELAASRARHLELEGEISGLGEWEERLTTTEAAHRRIDERHNQLFRRQVQLESRIKELEALDAQMDRKESRLKDLREEHGLHQELVEAFGRRGVQAMLIETVLPNVEEEANALLGRMTDDRMHVKLETQRERKSRRGDPIETLEIIISDELGPRSYELFSGGEAFRINLALRIALSKVLAHRMGAPLPTLFMDEGFGTQDLAGRERILDVIRAIEADFEKIIVITHLDDLKEAFPARIEVYKGENGSTFWLS